MALPTRAQWGDNWAKLSIYENLGMLLADQAFIFRAFMPQPHPRSYVKVNWTDGATADTVAVTAGAPQGTVAPAQVNDTVTKQFAAIGSQSVISFDALQHSAGFEEVFSLNAAIAAIYRAWLTGLLGSGAGTSHTVWGIQNFTTAAATAGSTMTNTSTTAADTLANIDAAVTSLPSTGYNICIVDAAGYNKVKALIRALGGVTSEEVKTEAFGASFLTFSGVTFFYSDVANSLGTSPSIDSSFNFFNIGPEGCQVIVPDNSSRTPDNDAFVIQGPKMTTGQFDKVFDIALRTQILYSSPRAAYTLIQRVV